MIYLTDNFTLGEMIASVTAITRGIDNTPPNGVITNLKVLSHTLESIRRLVNKSIHISSAYRSPSLNKAIGGAANSAHVEGLAADINVDGYTPKQLCEVIKSSGITFDQLICEPSWVHIGLSLTAGRNQLLTAKKDVNGIMKYTIGI